jgi:septal ring factor EnvC (AmiA/AmiB activator)
MITIKSLPHGKVSTAGVKDQATRDTVMRLNENIASLASQLAELQKAHQKTDRDLKAALAKIAALEAV